MSLTINHQFDSISASSGLLTLTSNSALALPQGTSVPASGNAGAMRYNAGALQVSNGTVWTSFNGGVEGPISSANNTIPTWSGTGGNLLQNTGVAIDSLNNVTGVNSITGTSLNFTLGTIGPLTASGTNVGVAGTVSSNYGVFTSQLLAVTLGSGDSSINVATTAFVQNLLSTIIPSGLGPIPYAGTTPPAGWLLCYGQSLSTSTYPNLFAAIGYTYGGSGTSFNLPDMRDLVPAGLGNMGGVDRGLLTSASGFSSIVLGAAAGNELLQSHNHAVNDPGHTHTTNPPSPLVLYGGGNANPASSRVYAFGGLSINAATTGITIDAAGGGGSQNVQPTIMLNYIIKT